MKVVALAGGTGSSKLLRGLCRLPIDLTVVANVGDNFWTYGVYVCPDIDVAAYSLAGIADRSRGWGVAGDTFDVLSSLKALGVETWFRLGDRDFATCAARTELLRRGKGLTEVTRVICEALGVKNTVLPTSDEEIETRVVTSHADLHLQEFWVRDRGRPSVTDVYYRGANRALPTREVSSALARADRILVCPANPISSIGPMLAMRGFSRMLSRSDARVVALSPMAGRGPFSGPAGKFLRAKGAQASSLGVARLYREFLDCILIPRSESSMVGEVEGLGVDCVVTDTRLAGPKDELRIAKELLDA